jgi:hypothetical protein
MPSSVLQSVFSVMPACRRQGFCKPTQSSTFIFLAKTQSGVIKKIKKLHPQHRTKTYARKKLPEAM